mmetsp:Transcript_18822/g.45234  ORF Transcript_18822/g.45234 Transcript_18822/m.45234 type:complete len:301 (-) Transcript_18822:225-1127(-)
MRTTRSPIWTQEEDAIISRAVVAELPFTRWTELATQLFPGRSRTGKQIRDRWNNYLNPSVDLGPFSWEDDMKLWNAQRNVGNRWVDISMETFHSTRSENQVKNRWNSAAFKQFVKEEFGKDAYVHAKRPRRLRVSRVVVADALVDRGEVGGDPTVAPDAEDDAPRKRSVHWGGLTRSKKSRPNAGISTSAAGCVLADRSVRNEPEAHTHIVQAVPPILHDTSEAEHLGNAIPSLRGYESLVVQPYPNSVWGNLTPLPFMPVVVPAKQNQSTLDMLSPALAPTQHNQSILDMLSHVLRKKF